MQSDGGLQKLLERISKGDESAFNDFYKRTNTFVFNAAFAVLCNYHDANDVSQNLFIKIFKIKSELLPKYNIISWLRTVVKNECVSLIRNRDNNTVELSDEIYEEPIENNVIDEITFEQQLKFLTEEEREIILLKIVSNMKHNEISKILGIPAATIRWKYRQIITKIREKHFNDET